MDKGATAKYVPFWVTVGAALIGFHAMFGRAVDIFFNAKEEDMTFGALVPLFSIYLLWEDREAIKKSLGEASISGFLATIPCLALAFIGARGLQIRLEQLGFIGLAIALPWAFFGWRTAKRCVFPAAYLLFTIPLATYLDVVTIHLRLLASSTALAVLNGFGISAAQQGTAIFATGSVPFSIDVAEPCSGLRSLFALMALTAAYARLYQPTWTRRALLFACSVPLAVIGNVVRIFSICLVSAAAGQEFGTGFYHDYSGYIVFIVAIILMLAISELIDRLFDRRKPSRRNVAKEAGK